ncbi:unnamed protein product [Macrosiphum euphorbiae]|uniref:Uncharacterized protein n=1 Tax=Macrosiphum euphorbiae TaxID=13131 RepID=A0AAV0VWF8_9HEMI|nr:unnamed protein product [Macrosiphum euphorbiae]
MIVMMTKQREWVEKLSLPYMNQYASIRSTVTQRMKAVKISYPGPGDTARAWPSDNMSPPTLHRGGGGLGPGKLVWSVVMLPSGEVVSAPTVTTKV